VTSEWPGGGACVSSCCAGTTLDASMPARRREGHARERQKATTPKRAREACPDSCAVRGGGVVSERSIDSI